MTTTRTPEQIADDVITHSKARGVYAPTGDFTDYGIAVTAAREAQSTAAVTEGAWSAEFRDYEGAGLEGSRPVIVQWADAHETPSQAITRLNAEVVELAKAQTPPAFKPEGEPDIYRDADSKLVTTTGKLALEIHGSYKTRTPSLRITADQATRILEMLSSEASE